MKLRSLDNVIAMVALFRPGPMEFIPAYIRRMHGEEAVEYRHPALESIFGETYGYSVYQEQLMFAVMQLAGYPAPEAHDLRKAVAKKIKDKLLKHRQKFIKGAVKNGIPIVLEVVVKANPSLKEIPISFADRIKGESKLSTKAQLDYLRHLWKLYIFRYRDWFKFLSFCLVGLSGMVIDTAILVSLVEILALDPRAAAVFAFMGAVSWNFHRNQNWTFTGIEYSRNIYWRYASFFLICVIGLVIRIGVMHLLIRHTAMGRGKGYIFASIIGIFTPTLFNFVGSRNVTFARKRISS